MILPAAIERRIDRVESGCWLWTGSIHGGGYGQIELPGREHWLAHRLVWKLHGGELPENLHHRPTCPKRCVNPAHLVPLTIAEHASLHGQRAECSEGHPFTPANTYLRRDGRGRQCRRCKATRQRRYDRRARDGALS